MSHRTLTILGSTGSIGTSTLDVVRLNRSRFSVYALAAGRNITLLAEQIREFQPKVVVVGEPADVDRLRALLPQSVNPDLLSGPANLVQIAVAPEADTVMSSIVGVAGLEATYEAVCQGKRIGLANKESLVSGGQLMMDAVKKHGAEMLPVDSEHNGAHQCLRAGHRGEATRLILTASGGRFGLLPRQTLEWVTPSDALKHPTWKMGNRITIDSATLMNKGFEVIEAHWLFGFGPDEIDVVVHPQSSVHAMVEYEDGSVIAQICATDMRMPIQYALTWPDRNSAPVPRIDWSQARKWEFQRCPGLRKMFRSSDFACASLRLNRHCFVHSECSRWKLPLAHSLRAGLVFPAIARTVEETLGHEWHLTSATSVAEILEADACRAARGTRRDRNESNQWSRPPCFATEKLKKGPLSR